MSRVSRLSSSLFAFVSVCRFINADPAGFSGGLNFYAFADGNPISMADPFGVGAMGFGGFSWINYSANDRIHDEFMAGYTQMQAQMASAWNTPANLSAGQAFSSLLGLVVSAKRDGKRHGPAVNQTVAARAYGWWSEVSAVNRTHGPARC
jgi:hypothetical protein